MTAQKKVYTGILAVVVTLIAIGGVIIAMEDRYAKASDVQKVEVNLNYYILSQRAEALQQRMWQIEDRYKCPVQEMPPDAKEAHRQMKIEREDILRKIEMIKKAGK